MKIILTIAAIMMFMPINDSTATTALDPLGKISKPEVAAKRLYEAWKRSDRPSARRVASRSAVNQLFKTRFTGDAPDWQFQGCERRASGYDCSYSYEGGAAIMRVAGSASAGYLVRSVKFIAD